ncbi:MAG: class I SAM-dependent methyltransferase [Kiritimatiellia bacterium]
MNKESGECGNGFPETADIVTSSEDYARRFSGAVGKWFLERQEDIVRRMLAGVPGRNVLDVGGGHGQLAIPLCQQGYKVTVVGSHESCAQRLEEALATGRCVFRVGNVLDLPVKDRTSDVVLCFRLLAHCKQWQRLIAELCRASRDSVIVDFPVSQAFHRWADVFFGLKKRIEKNTRRWQQFVFDEVLEQFRQHGFKKVAVVRQFFWPMALHRALKLRKVSQALETAAESVGWTKRWGSPVIFHGRRLEYEREA